MVCDRSNVVILEFAYDANLKHGKPLTLSQRKDAARLKLRRHTERSNNWIAQDCGISDHTIEDIREELESASQIAKLDKLLGRDKKWRPCKIPEPEEPEPVEPVKLYHNYFNWSKGQRPFRKSFLKGSDT